MTPLFDHNALLAQKILGQQPTSVSERAPILRTNATLARLTAKALAWTVKNQRNRKRDLEPILLNDWTQDANQFGPPPGLELLQDLALDKPFAHSLPPPGTVAIQIDFTLKTLLLSRDDIEFYVIDNPVRKEWIFMTPYLAGSQWKGMIRSVMIRSLAAQLEEIDEDRFLERRWDLCCLFGNEDEGTRSYLNSHLAMYRKKRQPASSASSSVQQEELDAVDRLFGWMLEERGGSDSDPYLRQGSLFFYPSFFQPPEDAQTLSVDVINPHSRKTGAGTHPIYYECVNRNCSASLTFLAVVSESMDVMLLQELVRASRTLIEVHGMGAKTSSGYGRGEINRFVFHTANAHHPEESMDAFFKHLSATCNCSATHDTPVM